MKKYIKGKQIERQINSQMDRKIEKQIDIKIEKYIDRKIEINIYTEQIVRLTNRNKHIDLKIHIKL